MAVPPPLLVDRWPAFAAELQQALRTAGELELARFVNGIRVIRPCGCGDGFCQSFHTAPPPSGAYGPGRRTVALDPPWPGCLVVDVLAGDIIFVEVLYRSRLA
jgi:hypothetical protein